MDTAQLDQIDVKILRTLQESGRITNLDLAEKVGLSSAQCLRRVRVLEESGVIQRYAAILNPRKLGMNLEFEVDVKLKQQTRSMMTSFERRVLLMPEIVECYLTGGEWDYGLRIVVEDLEHYQSFQLDTLMTEDSEIAAVRSTLIMRKIKTGPALSIRI